MTQVGMNVVLRFHGEYDFLSNFHASPFHLDGHRWPTVEHYYQAMKCASPIEQAVVREAKSPGEAKLLGRRLADHADWESVRRDVMLLALRAKFLQNPGLATWLLRTGEAVLVEGNTWHDNTWGVCYCAACPKVGSNLLGALLMQVRAERRRVAWGEAGAAHAATELLE